MKIVSIIKRISHGKLEPAVRVVYGLVIKIEWYFFNVKWWIKGERKPDQTEIELFCKNVTFKNPHLHRVGFYTRM